ncbi:DUF2059 domain-containing protein [Shewanella chilikensis]|uniref:DUF2059 domain-containing protein n=1 Tax=Shewanella chilikensis TaxID=558541 RepID=UPI001CD6B930|nr:DUF2059 domain-containing protein [Shewanella chilikensis]MCA0949046.1 DUF2059 domain-containing protein [Shewanella chilikensis]
MKGPGFWSSLVLGGILLTSPLALADDSSRRAQVEQLLLEMQMDSMMDTAYTQMEQMILGMQQQFNIKESEKPLFEEFARKSTQIFKQELGWDKLKQPLTDIYVKHYSDKEIADMLAFYSSDTGRSMVAKMPAVMQESMMMTQSLSQGLLPKMEQLQQEFANKLKAHREAHSGE